MSAVPATPDCPSPEVGARRRALLAWYDAAGRDLPWRREPSLYGTWVSEIMLQQTTVAAVRGRWEAFLARFPDVRRLAAAEEDEVIHAWSGLGYYRRARLLHAAARRVMAGGGRLPRTREGWRDLPGVGDYAAAAIASIGLGRPAAAVDANVRRVITRWHCADAAAASALRPRRLRSLAQDQLPADRPGDWNQALMDLGAAVCRADRPRCEACPVRRWCAAGRAGTAAAVPPPPNRAAMCDVVLGALVAVQDSRIMLMPPDRAIVAPARGLGRSSRRAMDGLLAGTLCLPLTPWYPAGDADPTALLVAAFRRWLRGVADRSAPPYAAGMVRHTITSHRLRIVVVVADIIRPSTGSPPGTSWRAAAGEWPRSTLVSRCLTAAEAAIRTSGRPIDR